MDIQPFRMPRVQAGSDATSGQGTGSNGAGVQGTSFDDVLAQFTQGPVAASKDSGKPLTLFGISPLNVTSDVPMQFQQPDAAPLPKIDA
jgi:hypothetical protein